MKVGILVIAIVLALSATAYAQCPGPNCYRAPAVMQPVMSAPVYQYVPQQIGTMQYTPQPRYRIHYPTPIRSWLFGSYVGGGYTAQFIPQQQANVR